MPEVPIASPIVSVRVRSGRSSVQLESSLTVVGSTPKPRTRAPLENTPKGLNAPTSSCPERLRVEAPSGSPVAWL